MKNDFIFKKLFRIKYNNKEFDIFIDQYKRKTFLEVCGNKYKYPLYEDFIYLFKIYNQNNPFVSYDEHEFIISDKPKKFKFKEFIKLCVGEVSSLILCLPIIATITTSFMSSYLTLDFKNKEIFLKVIPVKGKTIDKVSEASEFLGDKGSYDEIVATINNNDNLDQYYKEYAINLARYLFNKYPDADLRIFNNNMKDISLKIIDENLLSGNTVGFYNSFSNAIRLGDLHSERGDVITHEFMHTTHHWIENNKIFPQIRIEFGGKSLDEAMTNYVIEGMYDAHSYLNEMDLLVYLMNLVDYDYYDYEQEGISKLINLLKEKYPQVDIDYIIDFADNMTLSIRFFDDEFKFEDNYEFMNQLFNLCVLSIDFDNNIYHSFFNFMNLFDMNNFELLEKYLVQYNEVLVLNNVDSNLIIDDINYLTNIFVKLRNAKSDFRCYLNDIDIKPDKDDLYSVFRKYVNQYLDFCLDYNDINEIKLFFYDMLNIYNDYLYKNGFNRSDVLFEKDLNKILSKYENICVSGYCINKDDVLIPIVELNERDRVYGKNKFVSFDSEGNIILLDKNDMKENSKNDISGYNFKFLCSIIGCFDSDNIVLDESFWQKQFNILGHDYKKTEFLFNDVKIGEAYLYDVLLDIGNTEDGKNTFSLYTLNDGEKCYLYREDGAVFEQSVKFTKYCSEIFSDNISSFELNKYLNEDFLKRRVGGNDLNKTSSEIYDFLTYDIDNDIVWVHHPFNIFVNDCDINTTINKIYLDIGSGYADIWIDNTIDSVKRYFSLDFNDGFLICFRDVLDHYDMLGMGVYNFSFSREQILELYNMYINDMNLRSVKNSR